MISMDISIFPRVFCSQLYAATKAKRRMEEERMGKLEKYREDYEVSSVFFITSCRLKGCQEIEIFLKLWWNSDVLSEWIILDCRGMKW